MAAMNRRDIQDIIFSGGLVPVFNNDDLDCTGHAFLISCSLLKFNKPITMLSKHNPIIKSETNFILMNIKSPKKYSKIQYLPFR